jgi:hypothetical protein
MYRVLEYVQTPSLYVGTQEWLNPAMFQNPVAPGAYPAPPTVAIAEPSSPLASLAAPFNRVNSFRDPGRVNINTVFSRDVWDGLHHGSPKRDGTGDRDTHVGPDFDDELVVSRRGYNANNPPDQDAMLALSPKAPLQAVPTFFANPFRAPDAGDLVPLSEMMRRGSEAGLTRSFPDTSGPWVAPSKEPLFSSESKRVYEDPFRHAYFMYSPAIRLDNLVTTRSSVYAIWITIGFFEVEPAPNKSTFASRNGNLTDPALTQLYNRVYPDGYMFGREDGADTGAIRRLRGFYIIDRSLPVGYEPGVDHNLENIVRLRRRIQ